MIKKAVFRITIVLIGFLLLACNSLTGSPTPNVIVITATPLPPPDSQTQETLPDVEPSPLPTVDETLPSLDNRLHNPGFEGQTHTVEFGEVNIVDWWEPFYCEIPYTDESCLQRGEGNAGGDLMSRPTFQATTAPGLKRSGDSAQMWTCNYQSCWGGVYQTFPTTPGEVCEVGVWVQSWSAADPAATERHSTLENGSDRSNSTWRIRVDPTGGTYAWDSQVIASRSFGYEDGIYDAYALISLTFAATGDRATVFLENFRLWPFPHNENIIDDAYAYCQLPEQPPIIETPPLPPASPPETAFQVGEFTLLGSPQGDIQATGVVDILRMGDELWLYYVGPTAGDVMGLATSCDGLTWTHKGTLTLEAAVPSPWNQADINDMTILYNPGTELFEGWYSATIDANDLTTTGIGYATSSDGLHWSRVSEGPVIDQGPPGSWNEERIGGQDVVKVEDTYYLYYTATTLLPKFYRQIGCEISQDGVNWVQCPGNPLLSPEPEIAPFEGVELEEPSVIYHEGNWLMAYTGFLGPQGEEWRIGLAQSLDGLHWDRLYTEPLVSWTDPGEEELPSTLVPHLYLDTEQDLLWLWYSDAGNGGVVIATAPIIRP